MAEPYYLRIMSDIRDRIASGEWPPGSKLPSTTQLRDLYRAQYDSPTIAAATVRHAIILLTAAGELQGQQGQGVFVARAQPSEERT